MAGWVHEGAGRLRGGPTSACPATPDCVNTRVQYNRFVQPGRAWLAATLFPGRRGACRFVCHQFRRQAFLCIDTDGAPVVVPEAPLRVAVQHMQ